MSDWQSQSSQYVIQVRKPEGDETPLSDSEVLCALQHGVFHGSDEYEPVYILEKR